MTHAESYGGSRLRRRSPSIKEEGEEEYASYKQGAGHEAHVEEKQLIQPRGEGTSGESSNDGQPEGLGQCQKGKDTGSNGCPEVA
jgi:hypothetical protein